MNFELQSELRLIIYIAIENIDNDIGDIDNVYNVIDIDE